MVGLAMTAASAVMGMASGLIEDKEIVTKTKSYAPRETSFQQAGLYNTSIADVGETISKETSYEQTDLSKGLQMGSAAMGAAAPLVEGLISNKRDNV